MVTFDHYGLWNQTIVPGGDVSQGQRAIPSRHDQKISVAFAVSPFSCLALSADPEKLVVMGFDTLGSKLVIQLKEAYMAEGSETAARNLLLARGHWSRLWTGAEGVKGG